MACPVLIEPACIVLQVGVGHLAGDVAGGAIGALAGAIQSGVAWMVSGTVDWWIQIPSPDLASEPAVGALQSWLLPITVAVAVLAMITAAGKMALTRKANPLIDVGSGLVIIAATSAVGVVLPEMLLRAGDAWSSWVLQRSTGGQFGARLTSLLTMSGAASGVVVVLGVVAIILAAVQAVLMLFRQAALIVLAGVLPLAAAGTLTPGTRSWLRRVSGWMLALIFYKPAAAAVYASAFTMIGQGEDPRTILMGFAMVLLSLLALPVLMKFFTWTTGAVETAAGGGFLGTMVSGAVAVGALRASGGGPGGMSAADQARQVSAQLGPQGGGSSGAGPSGSGPSGAGSAAGHPAGLAGAGQTAGGARASAWMPAAAAGPGGAGPQAASGGAGAAAASTAGAGGAAGAAAGPWGAAASGLASGAAQAARGAAGAMQPEQDGD